MSSLLPSSFLKASAASRAIHAGLGPVPEIRAAQRTEVTRKRGMRGRPYRRIADYYRTGPFYRQVGGKWLQGEEWPIMETFFVHHFLHATKGWRTYTGGSVMRMPRANPPGYHVDRAREFYGHHYIARPPRFAAA
jgi:hypothetical protein